MTNPTIKSKVRDRLFYDKYRYSITFLVPLSTTLRGCTNSDWKQEELIPSIRRRHRLFMNSRRVFKSFNWIIQFADVDTDVLIDKLEQTCLLLQSLTNSKIVYEDGWITVYSNFLECIDKATELSSRNIRIAEAVLSIPRGYVKCRHSEHKYRIYLRHIKITQDEHKTMRSFITTYKDHIFQSRALKEWIEDNWHRYRPSEFYFFFETDDDKLEFMLDLTVPGIKSRVCNIISNKYNLNKE